MGLESIYQADVVSFQGAEIYRVIFSAGHLSTSTRIGQIIYVQIYSSSANNQISSSSSSDDDDGSVEYTEHDDDHDDHDDDDDD